MRTLNLGILAHVDAGKTTLTERLLYTAGAIDHVGSVDAGTTQTDSLDLERERGITIRSAVASFLVGDLAVNLVDTPGHPDFIAEVERVLGVLDGAVLVVSAVEGVQPQTPLLFRALQRLHVPTLIFVNKVDRAGADPGARPGRRWRGGCRRASSRWGGPRRWSRDATVVPFAADDAATVPLAEVLAEHDEAILRAYVGDEPGLPYPRLRAALARADASGPRPPGVLRLGGARGRGSTTLLAGDRRAPLRGRAATRTPTSRAACSRSSGHRAGERVAYVRLFAGTLRPRQRVRVGGGEEAKATSIKVFAPTGAPRRDHLAPGEMATVRGLGAVRVGDAIGEPPPGEDETARFPRPALEAVVFPRTPGAAGQPPGGAGPARRAGPAHRRPPGRPPPRDRGLALRRGPEGGHPGDARARLRHRRRLPRDDDRVHRAPGERRRGRGGHPRQDAHEHHGPQLAPEHQPVQGDARPADRARAVRVRGRVPGRGRAAARPAVPVQDRRRVPRPDGGVRPRGASRRASAGWQVTDCRRHDDRLRLRVARDVRGRLPAPHAARAGDRARAGRHLGVRAARGPRARDAERRRHRACSRCLGGSAGA